MQDEKFPVNRLLNRGVERGTHFFSEFSWMGGGKNLRATAEHESTLFRTFEGTLGGRLLLVVGV